MACLAVIGAEAVAVPLDAQIDDEMLAHALSDSGAGFVFTIAEGAKRIERLEFEAAPGLILLDTGEDDEKSWRRFLPDGDEELPAASYVPDDRAALFYTSGRTGSAKGVPLSHHNLTFQLDTLLESDLLTDDDLS